MKHADFLGLLDTWHQAKREISTGKSDDYADDADTLANFKRMQRLCSVLGIQPGERVEDVVLFLLLYKLDRICNLLHAERAPTYESVDDSFQDNSLYLDLLRALIVERSEWDGLFDKLGPQFQGASR